MNLKLNKSTLRVGNLNDYINIINNTNALSNTSLTVESFGNLLTKFPKGTKLSYRISSEEDHYADYTIQNKNQFINFYK